MQQVDISTLPKKTSWYIKRGYYWG